MIQEVETFHPDRRNSNRCWISMFKVMKNMGTGIASPFGDRQMFLYQNFVRSGCILSKHIIKRKPRMNNKNRQLWGHFKSSSNTLSAL